MESLPMLTRLSIDTLMNMLQKAHDYSDRYWLSPSYCDSNDALTHDLDTELMRRFTSEQLDYFHVS